MTGRPSGPDRGDEPAEAAALAVGLATALAITHTWFEHNSGWAPPDPETLVDWAAEDGCRAPDDCWVQRRGICAHGLVSWQVVLDSLAVEDAARWAAPSPGAGARALRGRGTGRRTR